jgi:hypothetical protein
MVTRFSWVGEVIAKVPRRRLFLKDLARQTAVRGRVDFSALARLVRSCWLVAIYGFSFSSDVDFRFQFGLGPFGIEFFGAEVVLECWGSGDWIFVNGFFGGFIGRLIGLRGMVGPDLGKTQYGRGAGVFRVGCCEGGS